jgi:FO synthase subunit 2
MPSSLRELLDDVLAGHRLTEEEAVRLFTTRGREVWEIAAAADELRERKVGDVVTYVRNQNIHVTNVCKNLCGFCGFGRRAGDPGAFRDDEAAIREKARAAVARNVTEICLLSGVHPDYTLDSYADLISWCTRSLRGGHPHRKTRTRSLGGEAERRLDPSAGHKEAPGRRGSGPCRGPRPRSWLTTSGG